MKMSNKVYDILKWMVIIFIPALSTLYSVLAAVWGLPFSDEISKTMMAIATFIGVCLGISHVTYVNNKYTTSTPDTEKPTE